MTGKEILEEEFERAGMRGYRADQVDVFLQKVATYVDEQEKEKSDMAYKMQILADKVAEYKQDEESIHEALLGAQKLAASILNEAKAKAEAMTREAQASADEMIAQAKAKVDSVAKESLQKANLDLSTIRREYDTEQRRYEMLKQEVSAFRASLLKQYKAHLDLLSNLPVTDEKPAAPKAEASYMRVEEAPAEETQPKAEPAEPVTEPAAEPAEVKAEAPVVEAQTIQSEVPTDDIQLEIEREEQEQTREFGSEKSKKDTKPEYGANRRGGRPSYIEKFGELKFGGFGEGDK